MLFKKDLSSAQRFFKKGGEGQKLFKKSLSVAGQVGTGLMKGADVVNKVAGAVGMSGAVAPVTGVAKLAGNALKDVSQAKSLKGGLEIVKKAKEDYKQFV